MTEITLTTLTQLNKLLGELEIVREKNKELGEALLLPSRRVSISVDHSGGFYRFDVEQENHLAILNTVQTQLRQRLDQINQNALMLGFVDDAPEIEMDQPPTG